MQLSFEHTLIEVWRQALVENSKVVELGIETFPVLRTPSAACDRWISCSMAKTFEGLSRTQRRNLGGAQLARSGKNVMQFLSKGRYVANVADGKVTLYRGKPDKLAEH